MRIDPLELDNTSAPPKNITCQQHPQRQQRQQPARGLARAFLLGAIFITMVLGVACFNAAHIWLYSRRQLPWAGSILPCQHNLKDTAMVVVVVMGAAQYNGTPSPVFQKRLDRAHDLYKAGCAAKILITGGKQVGDHTTEGEAGLDYLAAQGIALEALHAETQSTTSFENLANSLPEIAGQQIVIVTDDMHAYRTLWLSQHLGLEATMMLVPTHHEKLRYLLREAFILTAYKLGYVR